MRGGVLLKYNARVQGASTQWARVCLTTGCADVVVVFSVAQNDVYRNHHSPNHTLVGATVSRTKISLLWYQKQPLCAPSSHNETFLGKNGTRGVVWTLSSSECHLRCTLEPVQKVQNAQTESEKRYFWASRWVGRLWYSEHVSWVYK